MIDPYDIQHRRILRKNQQHIDPRNGLGQSNAKLTPHYIGGLGDGNVHKYDLPDIHHLQEEILGHKRNHMGTRGGSKNKANDRIRNGIQQVGDLSNTAQKDAVEDDNMIYYYDYEDIDEKRSPSFLQKGQKEKQSHRSIAYADHQIPGSGAGVIDDGPWQISLLALMGIVGLLIAIFINLINDQSATAKYSRKRRQNSRTNGPFNRTRKQNKSDNYLTGRTKSKTDEWSEDDITGDTVGSHYYPNHDCEPITPSLSDHSSNCRIYHEQILTDPYYSGHFRQEPPRLRKNTVGGYGPGPNVGSTKTCGNLSSVRSKVDSNKPYSPIQYHQSNSPEEFPPSPRGTQRTNTVAHSYSHDKTNENNSNVWSGLEGFKGVNPKSTWSDDVDDRNIFAANKIETKQGTKCLQPNNDVIASPLPYSPSLEKLSIMDRTESPTFVDSSPKRIDAKHSSRKAAESSGSGWSESSQTSHDINPEFNNNNMNWNDSFMGQANTNKYEDAFRKNNEFIEDEEMPTPRTFHTKNQILVSSCHRRGSMYGEGFSSYSSIPFASPQVHSSPQNNASPSFQPVSRNDDFESKLQFRPSLNNDGASIPLLPDLTLDEKKVKERHPRSISVDELKLIRMESGLGVDGGKQWRTAIESTNRDRAVSQDATQQCLNQEIIKQKEQEYRAKKDEEDKSSGETEGANGIIHKRRDLTAWTDASSSLTSPIPFSELKLESVIGGGGFGQVWEATWRGTPVAVKVLAASAQAENASTAILQEFAAEINLVGGMRHPNICLYIGACLEPPNRAIVTELAANGSVWDALRQPLNPPFVAADGITRDSWPLFLYWSNVSKGPKLASGTVNEHWYEPVQVQNKVSSPPFPSPGAWPWHLVKRVAAGTARGMNYLHCGAPAVLHRDLKSANILLDESYNAKVTDFGLSRLKAHERSMTTNCGTVQWMAPEILANERYAEPADIYSYGIVLWELLAQECPYDGMSPIQCALAVLNKGARPEIPNWCPPVFEALIKGCLEKDPQKRPTFAQIIDSLDAM